MGIVADLALSRAACDRLAIENGGQVVFTCGTHPGLPTTAIYQDGDLRLLCPACGFQVVRIKVADPGEPGGEVDR